MTTRGWLVWLGAAATIVLLASNPVVVVCAAVACAVNGAVCARRAPEGRSVWVFLKLGLVLCAMRVVLFGLTGHAGHTTLVHLPEVSLPRWLGAFAVGGRITAEEPAQQAAEGARIATLLVCFGVFLASVETSRVLRLVPRGLHQAGLVVSIALAFVPSMMRMVVEVRDAQRMRGHRFRGLRSLRRLVGPVLAGALERSLDLAASMETRGYGRRNPRTRVRAEPLTSADVAGMVVSGVLLALAVLTRTRAQWSAMPQLFAPRIDVLTLLPAFGLCVPALLAVCAAARLRAESFDDLHVPEPAGALP